MRGNPILILSIALLCFFGAVYYYGTKGIKIQEARANKSAQFENMINLHKGDLVQISFGYYALFEGCFERDFPMLYSIRVFAIGSGRIFWNIYIQTGDTFYINDKLFAVYSVNDNHCTIWEKTE